MRAILLIGLFVGLLPSVFWNPYAGVILYSWISFMSPHRLVWGFPEGIPLALTAAVFTLFGWLFAREPKKLPLNATVVIIILFMTDITFSTFWALNPGPAFEEWNQTIKVLSFVLVTIALTTNRVRFHALLWIMAISIGYYGLKGGLFSVMHGGAYHALGPPDTAIEDNNNFGAGLLVALPLMNYVRVNSARAWVRFGWAVVIVMSFLSILASYSRAALLALVVTGIFWFWKADRKIFAAATIIAGIVLAGSLMPEKFFQRVQTIGNYETDESASGRFDIWRAAVKIAEARPLSGGGFRVTYSQSVLDRFEYGVEWRAVHNIFLSVWAEHGIPGLVLWAALAIMGWLNARWITRAAEDRDGWQWAADFARMTQLSLVGYLISGAFHNTQYWDYYFTILALLVAARTMLEKECVRQQSSFDEMAALRRLATAGEIPRDRGDRGR